MEKSGAMMADFDEKENSTDMDGFQQHLFDCFGQKTCEKETQVQLLTKNRKLQVDRYKLKMMVDKGQTVKITGGAPSTAIAQAAEKTQEVDNTKPKKLKKAQSLDELKEPRHGREKNLVKSQGFRDMIELMRHKPLRPSSAQMARLVLLDSKVESNLNSMMENYLSIKQEIENKMSGLQTQEKIMTLKVWNP